MNPTRLFTCYFGILAAASAQINDPKLARAAYVAQVIDQAVNPLPAGFKGMVVGYLDDFGVVYWTSGIATVDGTVKLNEKTMFGIGSGTKLFAATLFAIANGKGLDLKTPVVSMLPPPAVITSGENRFNISLLDLADHHGGLPKNEGHLYGSVSDLYKDYAADPISCDPATAELIHDCGCCDTVYMGLLGLKPTCGTGVANPVYTCPTHTPTQGANGWVYSNLGFEVLGSTVAAWLGYPSWNQANVQEITQPLNMPDTMPLESFGASQVARAANHCNPATRTTNVNCQLLDWLPVGNAAGGLFSTAQDMLQFLSYNAYGTTGTPPNASLVNALPIVHKNYETSSTGGQELAWQNLQIRTGELEHWKDGANGPFNSWFGYVTGPMTRMIVLLDNSGSAVTGLGNIGARVLVNTGPSISSVTTAYGTSDIAQNTWIAIKGTNLVPASTAPDGVDWSKAPEFASGQLPAKLANVSVTVDGKPAFIDYYCSAATSKVCSLDQINVLTPLDSASGTVQIVVTNSGVNSAPFAVNLKAISPSFLLFNADGSVVATHSDGKLLGATSLYPGFSTPAKRGETVVVYGVGFGLPQSTLTNGSSTQSGPLPALPVCRIAGSPATVAFAGLISPGLYQLNIVIPSDASSGNQPISCVYSGSTTPAGDVIAIQ